MYHLDLDLSTGLFHSSVVLGVSLKAFKLQTQPAFAKFEQPVCEAELVFVSDVNAKGSNLLMVSYPA